VKAVRKTLFRVLRRIIFRSVVLTLVVGGVLFALVSFMTLRAQHEANMTLLARTTAYATEAAMMFGDHETATEILEGIVDRESLCSITIYASNGSEFAQANRGCSPVDRAAEGFLDDVVRLDIGQNEPRLGIIELRGDGGVFMSFLFWGGVVGITCLLLAVLAARVAARWMEQRFAAELEALAGMARAARLEGNFTRRLPAFEITEFNELGQDFNALFGEIQARNAELVLRQSQLEIANNTLSRMALCDSLTGLANRACFSEKLEKALETARADSTRVGILYIDNDHFKTINDNYGHATGDALLVNVGHRLSGAVRESDLVARLGGDEFAILLVPVSGAEDIQRVANKVLAAMSRKLRLVDRVDITLGVSIGMAIFPEHANDVVGLLRAADHAMYRAKRLGRGRACLYDPSLDSTLETE
jgi:diguanylate cyclase (GGDEF)-like protein